MNFGLIKCPKVYCVLSPGMGWPISGIPDMGWPISGIPDLGWPISGIPDLRLALLIIILKKNFVFGYFSTYKNQLLASNSSSISLHVYSAKRIGQKRSFLREIRAQTFYYPIYGVTTACCVP